MTHTTRFPHGMFTAMLAEDLSDEQTRGRELAWMHRPEHAQQDEKTDTQEVARPTP